MFLMIFVNDVAGVAQLPQWMGHAAADHDGMGFSDLIFPAFLFIVGLSLPYAIQGRIQKGKSSMAIVAYIVSRAIALVVMGFFHVNLESYNGTGAMLSYPVYALLLTLSFFLIWLDYKPSLPNSLKWTGKIVGVLLLLGLAYLYQGGSAQEPKGLEPSWWGILGIIGWAYLVSALVYLLTRGKWKGLVLAFVVFALINISSHAGWLHVDIWIVGDASSITLMLAGALLSTYYNQVVGKLKDKRAAQWMAIIGTLCIVFGLLVRPYTGGISKIYSTPAWVFICMGISILVFELLIYLVDLKGKAKWFGLIRPAGTSTLTCYLIPYMLYAMFSLVDFNYPHYFNYGIGGLIRSFLIAFLVIRIVAFLETKSLRLKI